MADQSKTICRKIAAQMSGWSDPGRQQRTGSLRSRSQAKTCHYCDPAEKRGKQSPIPHPLPPLQGWRGGFNAPSPYLGKGIGDGEDCRWDGHPRIGVRGILPVIPNRQARRLPRQSLLVMTADIDVQK